MEAMAADTTPAAWTDEQWQANLHQVFNVLGVVRGMKAPDIADAMSMPRSTFYDKVKKGSFTARELLHAAKVLDVPPTVFYEPVDNLFTGPLAGRSRTGRFATWLEALPEPTGTYQQTFDDLFVQRPSLSSV